MCAGCAIAAVGTASGVRSWLACHHLAWLTPRRLKAVTVVLFTVATVVSTVGLSGSSAPIGRSAAAPAPSPHAVAGAAR